MNPPQLPETPQSDHVPRLLDEMEFILQRIGDVTEKLDKVLAQGSAKQESKVRPHEM